MTSTVFVPQYVHIQFEDLVAVWSQVQQSWVSTMDLHLRAKEVSVDLDTNTYLLMFDGQAMTVPASDVTVSTAVKDTFPVDVWTLDGIRFAAKTCVGGMEAARALEGLGDLATMLAEAYEARTNEVALGFAIV